MHGVAMCCRNRVALPLLKIMYNSSSAPVLNALVPICTYVHLSSLCIQLIISHCSAAAIQQCDTTYVLGLVTVGLALGLGEAVIGVAAFYFISRRWGRSSFVSLN